MRAAGQSGSGAADEVGRRAPNSLWGKVLVRKVLKSTGGTCGHARQGKKWSFLRKRSTAVRAPPFKPLVEFPDGHAPREGCADMGRDAMPAQPVG
eukprot:9142286-Pyramimonas_sp.AAC.1